MAGNIVGLHVFGPDVGPEPLSNLDNNFNPLVAAINLLNTFTNYYADSGAADAAVVTLAAGQSATLTIGLEVKVKMAATNLTNSPQLNFNGTGNAGIKDINGATLIPGQLQAGVIYSFIYFGPNWLCLNINNFGVGGAPVTLHARKGADTGRTNTAVMTVDPDLSIAIPYAGTWLVTMQFCCFQSNIGNAGINTNLFFSGTFDTRSRFAGVNQIPSTALWGAVPTAPGFAPTATTPLSAMSVAAAALNTVATAPDSLLVSGVLIATSVGTLSFNWAQQTATAITTTVQAGAYLTASQLS